MVAICRNLPDSITLWKVSSNGTGGDLFAAPVLCKGIWSERQETFVGRIDRREKVSKAVVLIDRAVDEGDYLCLGDQTAISDPTTLPKADKIQRTQTIPDLRRLQEIYRVQL